jgi:hypothetical protein
VTAPGRQQHCQSSRTYRDETHNCRSHHALHEPILTERPAPIMLQARNLQSALAWQD